MAPLEDGNTGIEDDNTGARVVGGRLQIIPADENGNAATINAEEDGFSLSSRSLLYDAQGRPVTVDTDGGQIAVHLASEDMSAMLRAIRDELRAIRLILEAATDINFSEGEDNSG